LWFLDRRNGGAIKFVEGKPYIYQNVFRSLDPVTGWPDIDPAHKPGTGKRSDFCPGTAGGKILASQRVQPADAHVIYIPANKSREQQRLWLNYRPGRVHLRCGQALHGCIVRRAPVQPQATDHFGEVQAWSVDTGQKDGRIRLRNRRIGERCSPQREGWSFSGGTNDREVRAFDAKDTLGVSDQQRRRGSRHDISCRCQAVSRRALRLGGETDGIHGTIQRTVSGVRSVPEGGSVWVFALE
jgi:alcohol dehydrogenase (cytochrome c)